MTRYIECIIFKLHKHSMNNVLFNPILDMRKLRLRKGNSHFAASSLWLKSFCFPFYHTTSKVEIQASKVVQWGVDSENLILGYVWAYQGYVPSLNFGFLFCTSKIREYHDWDIMRKERMGREQGLDHVGPWKPWKGVVISFEALWEATKSFN